MPKYGIHHLVLRRAIDQKLSSGNQAAKNAASLLNGEGDAAMFGAVGPDLFFFAPDYPVMGPIITLYTNYKKVLDLWEDITEPIRVINEQVVEPVQEKVEDVLGEDAIAVVKTLLNELKETGGLFVSAIQTGLLSGVVNGADSIFSAAGVPAVQLFFREMFTPTFQLTPGAPHRDWFWFDLLHYRRTGQFARALAENASTPRQRAYALGYLSHIAADVTGHAYVNQVVGAPYRLNVQRHVTSENFMDTWAFDHYYSESVSSTLMNRLSLTDETCTSDIASLLSTAFSQTYPASFFSGQGKAFLSTDEIRDTYITFHGILGIMAGMGIERPAEPFPGVFDILEKAWNDVIQPPPSPPSTDDINCTWEDMLGFTSKSGQCWASLFESIAEWFVYLGQLAIWLIERIFEFIDFLLAALLSLPVMVLLALLYAIQLMLYELYRMAHWALAVQGFVFPLRDDLGNSVTARLVQSDLGCVPSLSPGQNTPNRATRYPRLTRLGDSHMTCPFRGSESAGRLWNFINLNSPADPTQFIETLPFNSAHLADYAASAGPDATFALERAGKSIGNAIDFTAFMISTASDNSASPGAKDVAFTDWNLDSDRGYGYKAWNGTVNPTSITGESFV